VINGETAVASRARGALVKDVLTPWREGLAARLHKAADCQSVCPAQVDELERLMVQLFRSGN